MCLLSDGLNQLKLLLFWWKNSDQKYSLGFHFARVYPEGSYRIFPDRPLQTEIPTNISDMNIHMSDTRKLITKKVTSLIDSILSIFSH